MSLSFSFELLPLRKWEWMVWMTLGFYALTKKTFLRTSLVNLPCLLEATGQCWNLRAKTHHLLCIWSPSALGSPSLNPSMTASRPSLFAPLQQNQLLCPLGSHHTFKNPSFISSITGVMISCWFVHLHLQAFLQGIWGNRLCLCLRY